MFFFNFKKSVFSTKQIRSTDLETTTKFIEDFPENTNSSELSWNLDLPEFSPELNFVEEILTLFDANNASQNSVHHRDPVNIMIFYETLSKPSRDFMVHQFFPTFAKLGTYINPELVPYGNANLTQLGRFTCEHGEDECQGNLVHACVANTKPGGTGRSMAYIGCMMNDMEILNPRANEIGEKCARFVHLDWEPIYNCTRNGAGMAVLRTYKGFTDSIRHLARPLKLPLVYIGTSEVSEESKNNFFQFMCSNLSNEPEACKTTKTT